MSSSLRAFTPAWLAHDPAATALLSPRDAPTDRAAATRAAAQRAIDPAVLASLHRRYPTPTPAQAAHLKALAAGGAACVVSGQQAGLFGGPLYTLHKAAAAIRTAAALGAEAGCPCVPIFWLQNEDHDYAEIDHTVIPDGHDALRTLRVPGDPADDGRPVGARRLGAAVIDQLAALAATLPAGPHREATLALIGAHYRPEAAPDAAFAGLMDALFADRGLLIVDPRAPGLADAAAPLHRWALAHAQPIADALAARAEALTAAGFTAQVYIRPGAPLSFFHPDGADAPRWRLAPAGPDAWRRCGPDDTLPRAAVQAAPAAHFSTSALLRPLLQDTWLPTAAYLGGPGEIAYLAQCPPLYQLAERPLPLWIHRARLRLTTPALRRVLDQLGVTADDLGAGRDALLTRCATAQAGHPTPEAVRAALHAPLAALEAFAPTAAALDRGLAKATARAQASVRRQADRLADRYARTLAQQDATTAQRLDRALTWLQPAGAPQERVLNWTAFAPAVGPQALVQALLDAVVPFDPSVHEVAL